MKKILLLLTTLTLTTAFLQNCDTTEPNNKAKITLTALDASCTEVWLKLNTESINLPTEITITENDTLINNYTITKSDTTLFVENLLPNKNYTFRAFSKKTNKKSQSVSITTMDTTSHNFTWQSYSFGGGGSSYFSDVAIIDENNIWAVGEIYTEDTYTYDSNGVWIEPYNAAHWNGEKWELKRILFYIFCEQEQKAPCPAQAIYYLGNNLLAIGSTTSQITYIKDGIQKQIECLPSSITKMWGSSGKNIYVVGYNGNIAHYNGESWQKIESGTKTLISDVWGTNNNTVYCTVSNLFIKPEGNDKKILKITEVNNVKEINWEVNRILNSIWSDNNTQKYVGGDGLFVNNTGSNWEEIKLTKNYSISLIRGTEKNNIVLAGSFGLTAHFNGISWKAFDELSLPDGYYSSLALENKTVVIVGANNNQAIVTIGKQN